MTLRARLTTAFLVMVLGPVLLGAVFVGVMVGKVGDDRVAQRLDLAANSVRTSVGALCAQLATVAEAVAAAPEDERLSLAAQFVARGLTSGVHIDQGEIGATTQAAPPPPWADCSGASNGADLDTVTGFEGIAAGASTADGSAHVQAAFTADRDLLRRLSGATGAEVTLLAGTGVPARATGGSGAGGPGAGDDVGVGMGRGATDGAAGTTGGVAAGGGFGLGVGQGAVLGARAGALREVAKAEPMPPMHSTLDAPLDVAVVATALADGGVGRTANGDQVRRIGPVAGEPLPMAISLRGHSARGTQIMLIFVVLLTGMTALMVAWWLARTATSPLAGLAAAADRVAGGDLQTRVPVRGNDEIGRLSSAFNHMTRELDTYVTALTASRDQLRGHLGVLGDTLSSTHDLDRILQVILQTARHATGAAGGIVLLADSTGELVGKCSEGLDGDVSQVRVAIGQGLCGSVAATGVPRLGRIDRDGPSLAKGEPMCRTYMVVPFSAPLISEVNTGPGLPPARGVLALYDRLGRSAGCDDFDDQDLMTLRTFAGQAAVAVDNVRVHEEAQRLSVTDSLTGLFNYRSLRETLRRESDRAGRFGRKLAVLALDLDHFKDINDRYGHAAGDAVLAEFAQRIKYEVREVDLAFRMGGEEFVVLLPETDEVGGVAVAERLGAAIRDTPIAITNGTIRVNVSIGIAVLPDHGTSGTAVLRAADEALYAAKTAGRDTFRVALLDPLCAIGGASGSPQAPRQAQGR